ncbi:hypothetical protein [Pantoea agglomerans]|uniref:hypothetical protein n=1 Tax=Enterobacter agglomerans TaxID=549 RepID=UPI00301DDA47
MNVTQVGNQFNCDCGFTWVEGKSGAHECGEGLRRQIASLKAQRDALAAENAILKNGIGFFSYGTDSGFEEHDSAEKAIAAADSDIDYYRGDACDGWSEETEQTVWGVILQRATMIDERPHSEEFPDGSCDFALLPNLATPATDAYHNSLRAEGVEMFANHCLKRRGEMMKTEPNEAVVNQAITATRRAGEFALHFAAQLRAGKDGE